MTAAKPTSKRSDAVLAAAARAGDADAFGELFRRHHGDVLRFLHRRCGDVEVAADLMAETFAAALASLPARRTDVEEPRSWLLTIAHRKLIDSHRRAQVDDAARRALAMQPVTLDDVDLERLQALVDAAPATALAAELPAEQRHAVRARVLEERSYEDIAAELRTSPMVVRKRVSRALSHLRTRLEPHA